jgi:uncharacterized protein YdbL (DUF1318 family)
MKQAETKKLVQDLQDDINQINIARNKDAAEVAAKHNLKVDLVLRCSL